MINVAKGVGLAVVVCHAVGCKSGGPASTVSMSDEDLKTAKKDLKQLAMAAVMYASDADDKLPIFAKTEDLKTLLKPYAKDQSIWDVPAPEGTTSTAKFEMNLSLSGLVIATLPDPGQTVLFYMDKPLDNGNYLVTYSNTNFEEVPASKWATAEKTLHLKLN